MIEWTQRENAPAKQEKATQTVMEQAEVLSAGWVEEHVA